MRTVRFALMTILLVTLAVMVISGSTKRPDVPVVVEAPAVTSQAVMPATLYPVGESSQEPPGAVALQPGSFDYNRQRVDLPRRWRAEFRS